MNLSFKIASKYFFSTKKRGFIHFISIISVVGVAVGMTALIIVLSVFNGLEKLNREIFKISNPDLKISHTSSKTFENEEHLLSTLRSDTRVDKVVEVIEDNALAKQGEDQLIVTIKGVDDSFEQLKTMQKALVDGTMYITKEGSDFAFVGAGVYNYLNLSVDDFIRQLEIWYPRNQKLNVLNPESNINKLRLPIAGVFALEQQYDNHVYLPIHLVEALTGKKGERSALEIYLKKNDDIDDLKNELGTQMPQGLEVKDRDELNIALFRAIRIEKLFIFIALLFIIGIASFNIFFSLSMLVLDKKDDIENLFAIGASEKLVSQIFLKEGFIIAATGSIIGLIIGSGICLSQIYFGWLKMGMEFAIVDAYPVVLKWSDIIFSIIGIMLIALAASYFPSRKAVSFMKLN